MTPRRLVVTVCPRERGVVVARVERGGRRMALDAKAIHRELASLVARRGLGDRVRIEEGCAGGCWADGPNVTVSMYTMPGPGEAPDHVAVGRRTYVESLANLGCLAEVIDDNLGPRVSVRRSTSSRRPPARRRARTATRSRR